MLPLTIEEGHGEIQKSTGAPSSPGPMRYSSLSLKELVCLCAADPRDDDAWKEFVSRVNKPIALTIMRVFLRVLRVKPSLSLVQDLAQETYVKLLRHGCRRLRDFAIKHSDDGAILGYIKKTAANATHDCIRRYPPVPTIDIDPETEQKADRSQERTVYRVFLNEIDCGYWTTIRFIDFTSGKPFFSCQDTSYAKKKGGARSSPALPRTDWLN